MVKNKGGGGKQTPHHHSRGSNSPHGQPQQKQKPKQVYKRTHPFPATAPPAHSSKAASNAAPHLSSKAGKTSLSSLQQQFKAKLEGSRFRVINEQLYTTEGAHAFETFQADPSLFDIYHQGFREQASKWPQNPLDAIIAWIRRHARARGGKGGKAPAALVVADMGCGDARLGLELMGASTSKGAPSSSSSSSSPSANAGSSIIVHSFDLVAPEPNPCGVVACDIAHTPLAAGSVDVVVFCLALMGTNIMDFVTEAHRILRVGGILKIAEVRSRFEEGEGVKRFIRALKKAGFDLAGDGSAASSNASNYTVAATGAGAGSAGDAGGGGGRNEMFFEIEGRKSRRAPEAADFAAKPCIYKRR